MRLSLLTVLLVGLTGNHLAFAAVSAPITEVVLYPGSATIIRTVQVNAGKNQVEIAGLPAQFDPQTLHAEAPAGIAIGEIVTKDLARTEAISPNEADLAAKILALQDQQANVDAEIKSQEIVKNYLERQGGDGSNSADKSAVQTDAKHLTSMIDTIARSARDALLKIQTLNVQKRELQKKIDALNRDLARQQSGNSDARSVSISVNADHGGTVKLSYQIRNAGWKPAYRASLDSASSRIDLDRLATVSQKSGEDWTNIKLTLSTNQPNLSPVGPDPQPWLLTYYPPAPVNSLRQMPMPVAAPAPMQRVRVTGSTIKPAAEDDYNAPIFESQSTFSTQFDVPAKVSLLSDGREVTLTLATLRIPVKQFLRITPRLDTSAIVMAEAERATGVWLRGSVQLIRDGNYVGATNWNPDANDKFIFSFGRDDLIKVDKTDLKNNSGTTGFIDKKNQKLIDEMYSVTNSHKSGVNIEVIESSPVSTSDEISVKVAFDPKPGTDTWMQRRGIVAWNKLLAPNETAKFTVNYTIDYPKEGGVSGLR